MHSLYQKITASVLLQMFINNIVEIGINQFGLVCFSDVKIRKQNVNFDIRVKWQQMQKSEKTCYQNTYVADTRLTFTKLRLIVSYTCIHEKCMINASV